jgi:multidrug transporter EmrE-like cation transporter
MIDLSLVRIAAFNIRSVLAGLKTGDHLGVVVAYEILSPVGYFGLLLSAYMLFLDR